MSFDNYYPRRKDRRANYYGSKSFDRSCRPGGGCDYCARNRTFQYRREKKIAGEKIADYMRGWSSDPDLAHLSHPALEPQRALPLPRRACLCASHRITAWSA